MNWIIDLSRAPLWRKSGPWENGITLRLSPLQKKVEFATVEKRSLRFHTNSKVQYTYKIDRPTHLFNKLINVFYSQLFLFKVILIQAVGL